MYMHMYTQLFVIRPSGEWKRQAKEKKKKTTRQLCPSSSVKENSVLVRRKLDVDLFSFTA